MNLSKSQFYGGDGTGRDTYIYMANGGFCPEKKPTRIDGVSKYTLKSIRITILEIECQNGPIFGPVLKF
jgi:hypothetical protein